MELIKQNLNTYYPQFDEDLKHIIATNGRIQKFKVGETIMQQGQFLKHTMLITRGRVKLLSEGEDGEEFFMYYLEAGQACALSFVCAQKNKKSDLDATIIEDTEAILIPIELMDELMIKNKSWYYFVLDTYRSRFRELLDVIKSVAFHSMDERLSYYLVKQKNAYKSNLITLTHEQIANDLNSSRVVISRLLKQMETQKKVKLHRNAVEIL
ncbi:MAG: Crp/Fnr family transcriptional regulator [Sphingobacteriales bacterium]|jgi:CRP/FNR family transcriptional regulator|nr:Crp/Fnr family transcriptional regulator [Sphingobacteriales bacterium]